MAITLADFLLQLHRHQNFVEYGTDPSPQYAYVLTFYDEGSDRVIEIDEVVFDDEDQGIQFAGKVEL